MSSKSHTTVDHPQSTSEEDDNPDGTPSDPFADEAVTSLIDAAWDDLTS